MDVTDLTQENEESITTIDDKEESTSLLLKNMIRPTRLTESAGSRICCIFRVPQIYRQHSDTMYEPKILSIGPYHWGKEHLQMIEEHKQRYLEFFVSLTQKEGVSLNDLVDVVRGLEQKIRDSYSEALPFDTQKLSDLMVLDGCFILMLFLVVSGEIEYKERNDPIFKMRWILLTLQRDLLLLENQVPYFLLDALFTTSKLASYTSVNRMAFEFFYLLKRESDQFVEKRENLKAKHLLDLIRKTFNPVPPSPPLSRREFCTNTPLVTTTQTVNNWKNCLDMICCSKERNGAQPSKSSRRFFTLFDSARKLHKRGIVFKLRECVDTPLAISCKGRLLEIPPLTLDDFIACLMINCVAFEQFNTSCAPLMTSYTVFMGCLINTKEDVTFLSERGIIKNHFGTGEELALFFKNIEKDVAFSMSKSHLAGVFEAVNMYRGFKMPWKLASSAAALILLILTIIQTFFTCFAYFHPPKP